MIDFYPDGRVGISFTPNELAWFDYFIQKIRKSIRPTLKLDPEEAFLWYSQAAWIEPYKVPYALIKDAASMVRAGWVPVRWGSTAYELPRELSMHKERMIEVFDHLKQLRRRFNGEIDNQRCPRVLGVEQDGTAFLQPAYYADQVATNLCLDYPLESPIKEQLGPTIRTIDRDFGVQAGSLTRNPVPDRTLRPLEQSFLANTLGVCCLVACRDGKIPYRIRSDKTAIYQQQAHVPVSYAQELPLGLTTLPASLEQLIWLDLPLEFYQETGVELSHIIKKVVPLGLCRDIFRAGKPQLFLLLIADCDGQQFSEALRKSRLKVSGPGIEESGARVFFVDEDEKPENVSPELAASLHLLKELGNSARTV